MQNNSQVKRSSRSGTGTEGDLDRGYRDRLLSSHQSNSSYMSEDDKEQSIEIRMIHIQEKKLNILNQIYQIVQKQDLFGKSEYNDSEVDSEQVFKNFIGSKKHKRLLQQLCNGLRAIDVEFNLS